MEYTPPPLFKQGMPAFVRMLFFVLLALAMLTVDSRLNTLAALRSVTGLLLYPFEQLTLLPGKIGELFGHYVGTVPQLGRENEDLRAKQLAVLPQLQRNAQLEAENAQLRKLLELKENASIKAVAAEIDYATRDPYTRKVVIDKGQQNGIGLGAPVIDERGVLGQVTRLFPWQAEVTLLTDSGQSIPIQVVRNGLRGLAQGGSQPGTMELRLMAATADLVEGDWVVTSGLDGLYPPGLPVAKVRHIERKTNSAFVQVICDALAGVEHFRQVLVLHYDAKMRPAPPLEMAADALARPAGPASLSEANPQTDQGPR